MSKRNIKLCVEYDGTDFHGWQFQSDHRTVQGEIEKSLIELTGEKVSVLGSGRTDVGVHALCQIANFRILKNIELRKIREGLNRLLPEDVKILDCEEVDEEFHSRFDAIEREYLYRIIPRRSAIFRNRAAYIKYDLDMAAMNEAARVIIDETDFNSFCKTNSDTENKSCKVSVSEWKNEGEFIQYTIRANRFLHHMVRSLVGTMIDIGRGKLGIDEFKEIFKKSNRIYAGPNAPAMGLYLNKVYY